MDNSFTLGISERKIYKFEDKKSVATLDKIVVEEPLEIQLLFYDGGAWIKKSLAVTMRTPGDDKALAIGFLFSEGIIGRYAAIETIEKLEANILLIRLNKQQQVALEALERNFYATSSCGICGKASIEKLEKVSCFFPQKKLPKVTTNTILELPIRLLNKQPLFDQTGGIHAAAIFSRDGTFLDMAEDVGRHNAVDKLIGNCLLKGPFPLRNHILVLSGRLGFELVQKAMMAAIPVIAAVGAPSSLAIELAEEMGMTVIGFLKENRFNVYAGVHRIDA